MAGSVDAPAELMENLNPEEGSEPEEWVRKEVEMTVAKTDDPTMPVLTFRVWALGVPSCVLLSFVNQFFWYRTQPMSLGSTPIQIAVLPVGHLMARILPRRVFFAGRPWQFTLNPCPFNVKEHVLITILAGSGAGTVFATHILSSVKLLYKRSLSFLPALILMATTQMLGYGWAGIFRKHLVDPPEMWWPVLLVNVSFFRALHEKEKRPKGGTTRTQFFVIAAIASFAYYVVPGYLFLMLTSLSWLCWVAPRSVTAQQLGSGLSGLGLGSLTLDWATLTAYLGSPLASPWFATANTAAGFALFMYFLTPLAYWNNVYHAKTFPLYSNDLFTSNGSRYDIASIVDRNFRLDKATYSTTGPINISTLFAIAYGFGFATLSATVVHVILFNGRDLWRHTTRAFGRGGKEDIHTRMMKKYKQVPMWWYLTLLALTVGAILFAVQHYSGTLQLPWWGVLLACAIAIFFTLPVGIIAATTNQGAGLNIITEYIIGYLYPERPVANMCFKIYGSISMSQALTFLADLKFGHYMKIPPRAMFIVQVAGSLIAVLIYQITAWEMMKGIPNLCDTSRLPKGSPWTCPTDRVFYDASVIWGLVGPRRIFGNLGAYAAVNWFFLGGAVAPLLVWVAHKAFPKHGWIRLIHIPVLLGATSNIPPASAVNFASWILVAFVSGFLVFRYRQKWWERYNYVLAAGLDAGTSIMTVVLFVALGSRDIGIDWWGNRPEGCPLASCPTAKGVVVDGCPAFS